MAISSEQVQSEIRYFCQQRFGHLEELASHKARIELVSAELPRLLLNKELCVALMTSLAQGDAYPDIRRPAMFDNEVLLYLEPQRLFSLRLYLWGPGEYTHPHDHNSWGVIGAVSEGYEVINYRREDDESHEGYARLAEVEQLRLKPGETAYNLPFSKGIHKTGNAGRGSIATIHLYGKPLPRGYLNSFDITTNRVYRLYSPRRKKELLAKQALQMLEQEQ